MPPANLPRTMEWLMRSADEREVPAGWVPGASAAERRALHRLGGLARGLLQDAGSASALKRADAVGRWLSEGAEADLDARDEVRAALLGGADQALAGLYAGLVRSSNRRPLGTFFTPDTEASYLLGRWSATQPNPQHVVDVGAGVGVFTVAAARQWPSAQIHAVDINPVTLGLLAVRLVTGDRSGARKPTGTPHLILGDYMAWLASSWSGLEGPRLVLGNPPYTRASLLPLDDRSRLVTAAGGLAQSRASLSTIMTAVSLNALEPGDGLCLLLPAQWLEAGYASPLRHHLWNLTSRRIEMRLFPSGLFEEAQVDAVMLLVGAQGHAPGLFVAADTDAEPRKVLRSGSTPDRWRAMVDGTATTSPSGETVTLGSLARVRRGTATGANSYFVLSADVAKSLSAEVKVRLLRRLTGVGNTLDENSFSTALKGTRQWLLLATPAQRARDTVLDAYIAHGESLAVDQRFLCVSRGPERWFDLHHDLFQPDVVIGAMTKDRFQVVKNLCSAAITNNLYGWTWHAGVSDPAKESVLAWLRSTPGQEALRVQARQQGDRLFKLEPNALSDLPIPTTVARGVKP